MLKILIIDDDTDLLEMISLALTRYNMNVGCINKGNLVMESMAASKPDIVLMDIYLGDSDGRDLCRSLKKSDEYNNIPVILYSAGHITANSVQESLADDFVSKPFDISKLVKTINLLAKKQE